MLCEFLLLPVLQVLAGLISRFILVLHCVTQPVGQAAQMLMLSTYSPMLTQLIG